MTPAETIAPSLPIRRQRFAWLVVGGLVVAALFGLVPNGLNLMRALDADESALTILSTAQTTFQGQPIEVALPTGAELTKGEAPPVQATYVSTFHLDRRPTAYGLFMPALAAHARVSVNGAVVFDTLAQALLPTPRSFERIVLMYVPDAAWQVGDNTVSIEAAAPARFMLSTIELGPIERLSGRYRSKLIGAVIGPAIVAAVVGSLSICMLMLWVRRRDALYGYFGGGTLGWAIHTAWSVLPWTPLRGDQHTVWWTSLYSFFVAMLIIFCVRFADWHWRRFERALMICALAAPLVLYGALAVGVLDDVTDVWRMLWIALTGVGAVAVARASLRRPNIDRLLVVFSGATSFAFGVHDWLHSMREAGNNPVYLVPYAGLLFVVFVVRLLIDGFVRTTQELEVMNKDLERLVADQNAELRSAMEDMRDARDAAEEADQAKTRFLAAASHDLRQPAHALALYMAALSFESLDQKQTDLIRRMGSSLAALETMFDALLDVSRIDAAAQQPAIQRFSLAPMLRRLAQELAPEAEAKGLRFAVRLPAQSGDATVASDPMLVERILRNLLANAIKYTAHGGVLLACRPRRSLNATAPIVGKLAADAPCWQVEIWDTGAGIADQDRQRIFEEFFQVGNSGRDRSQGLGLGLAIVHRLVRMLDAALFVDSHLSRGSRFVLSLPVSNIRAMPTATDLVPEQNAEPLPFFRGLTVAVLEDDTAACDAMQRLLERCGCKVVAGACANDVERARCDRHVDALVADYRLGEGRTGPDEATTLFRNWQTIVPMLIVTGESELDAVAPVVPEGLTLLAKPVVPKQLYAWLRNARHLADVSATRN